MPEAIVALGKTKRPVGRLRFASDGRRQYSQFEYTDEWLGAKDRFALAPGLPLREGSHFSSGSDDRRSALPGCFADAAPDSWGRALMTRAVGGGLSEFDYLVRSDDRTRHGALRFLGDNLEPLSDFTPPVPRLIDLEHLISLAHRFEQHPGEAEEEALGLAGAAGSLGGARPKASVVGDGHLWIAKFTSARDTKPIERLEVATLKLGAMCGLRVAEARLALRSSDSPVALIRRFDRQGDKRIPYISARTALGRQGEEGGYYTDIADVIRQISSRPVEDLHELWRRMVFTILVSNEDDHLKNHGFIYAGDDRWQLSPAFDINPSPFRHRVLKTGIMEGGSLAASLEIALEACEYFDLKAKEARQTAAQIAKTISENWRQVFREEGASSADLRLYSEAFEHGATEQALGFVSGRPIAV